LSNAISLGITQLYHLKLKIVLLILATNLKTALLIAQVKVLIAK